MRGKVGPPPFNFDAGCRSVCEYVEFLHPDPGNVNAPILEASFCDPLGQSFDQAHMARSHDRPRSGGELAVVDDAGQFVTPDTDT